MLSRSFPTSRKSPALILAVNAWQLASPTVNDVLPSLRRLWVRVPRGPPLAGNSSGFEPGLSDRGSRHLLKLRHQRSVRVGPVADSCDAGTRPIGLWRCAGVGDQVQRERHFLDDPLDLLRIGEAGDEETAGASVGEGLPALDRLVDQRRVMRLRLEVQVGAGVDEKMVADGAADRFDALRLQRNWVHTLAADDLVFEIAADRARRGQADDILGALVRVIGIGAFEIDGQRQ